MRNRRYDENDQILQAKRAKQIFDSGTTQGIQTVHAKKLSLQLAALDTATSIDDIELWAFYLIACKGVVKNLGQFLSMEIGA